MDNELNLEGVFRIIADEMEQGVLKYEQIKKLTEIFITALELKIRLDRCENDVSNHELNTTFLD